MTTFGAGETLAGRYRLEGPIGAGAAGLVLAAQDELLDRAVVVKIVRALSRMDSESAARLEREARAAARIGHPHIVQVLDLGRTEEGFPFVVMERLRGETLDALLNARDRLEVPLAIELHLQLLDGLAAAHDAGVLHRDVKPPNVIVSWLDGERPFVKLLDFGLAALEDASAHKLTQAGAIVGSPAYLAPELLMGREASARTDVYATGVSLYECLAGRAPFHAPSPQALRGLILGQDPPALCALRSDVPPELSAIVERAMAKDPEARFPSARAMREALLAVQRPSTVDARAPSLAAPVTAPPPSTPRASRSLWITIGLLAVGAMIGAVSMAVTWTRADAGPGAAPRAASPPTAPRPASRTDEREHEAAPAELTGDASAAIAAPDPASVPADSSGPPEAPAEPAAPSPTVRRADRAARPRPARAHAPPSAPAPAPSDPAPRAQPRVGEHLLDPFEKR